MVKNSKVRVLEVNFTVTKDSGKGWDWWLEDLLARHKRRRERVLVEGNIAYGDKETVADVRKVHQIKMRMTEGRW